MRDSFVRFSMDNVGPFALQAQESSSDDDEDVALLSRNIAQMLRGRRKFGNTSKVFYECRKPGHFKDECPNLKKKEENKKMKKKPTWKGDKKKKAFKATWSDSSEGEDNDEGGEGGEEVNLCLMAKSSEGEVSIADISNEELSDALSDLLCTYRITRRELKRSRQENLKLVEQISLLTERLEEASSFPAKENEYFRKLGEENTRLEMEKLRERYDKLLGSQKALETLLGSQKSVLRKEGLGYKPDDTTRVTEGTKWIKEGTEDFLKFPEPQGASTVVDIEKKGRGSRNYIIDETIRRDRRYRYLHSYGMLGEHRIVDKLIDPTVSTNSEPLRGEHSRVIYSHSVPTSSRLRSVGRNDKFASNKKFPMAHISPSWACDRGPYRMDPTAHMRYHHMVEHPQFYHSHIIAPHHMPLTPLGIVDAIPKFRLPQIPPWAPMGWN